MESVFHHAGIYCRDIEESITFYEDVLGCRLLFRSDALEGDKPLKMAWAMRGDLVFELLECEDKRTCEAAANCLNHVALRVDDMDGFVAHLGEKGVAVEAGPFDPPLEFDRPLAGDDADVFTVCGEGGAQLKDHVLPRPRRRAFRSRAGQPKGVVGRKGSKGPTRSRFQAFRNEEAKKMPKVSPF